MKAINLTCPRCHDKATHYTVDGWDSKEVCSRYPNCPKNVDLMICQMVSVSPDENGMGQESPPCGKPRRRETCCDECFEGMIVDGEFTRGEAEREYPIVQMKYSYEKQHRIVELPAGAMLPREIISGPTTAYQHYDFVENRWATPGDWRCAPYAFYNSTDGRPAQAHIDEFLERESNGTVYVYRSNDSFAAFKVA